MSNCQFITTLIKALVDEDGTLPERLRFYTGGKDIRCWIDVSDVFEWGTADSYDIEEEDLASILVSAYEPDETLLLLVAHAWHAVPGPWFLSKHPALAEKLAMEWKFS